MSSTSSPTRVPIERLLGPFQRFTSLESSGGILLMISTFAALVWANSPWAHSYEALWNTYLSLSLGPFSLSYSLHHWINDGLMAIFFFVVGLEIKREVLIGELATPRKSALPIAGAIGGMVFPALIYFFLNPSGEGARGWGVPMATDIAFAVGVLALLGNRIPVSVKIFLTALAIVDDIGAVLVIAVFYTEQLSFYYLGLGAVFLIGLIILNLTGARSPLAYAIFGVGLWFAFLKSGVHATIAGVISAMTIPATSRISTFELVDYGRAVLHGLEKISGQDRRKPNTTEQQAALSALERACERAETPMQRLEHALIPWVSFVIMPVFALSNAGVSLGSEFVQSLAEPVTLGIVLGLLVGKPIGIFFVSWLAVRLNLAQLGPTTSWRHIIGAGCLGGIGFTMSLFIANLAFQTGPLLVEAKVGILTGSLLSGIVGWLILSAVHRHDGKPRPPKVSV